MHISHTKLSLSPFLLSFFLVCLLGAFSHLSLLLPVFLRTCPDYPFNKRPLFLIYNSFYTLDKYIARPFFSLPAFLLNACQCNDGFQSLQVSVPNSLSRRDPFGSVLCWAEFESHQYLSFFSFLFLLILTSYYTPGNLLHHFLPRLPLSFTTYVHLSSSFSFLPSYPYLITLASHTTFLRPLPVHLSPLPLSSKRLYPDLLVCLVLIESRFTCSNYVSDTLLTSCPHTDLDPSPYREMPSSMD